MSPPVELGLVHRPDGALHVLHPAEALVERQVVSDGVLTTNIGSNRKLGKSWSLGVRSVTPSLDLPFYHNCN